MTAPSKHEGVFLTLGKVRKMQDNEKSGITFVNIPMEIFSSEELTANEKILYGYLSIFRKQCCFRSNEALAETLGVSVPTVTRGLKKLEQLGYIFIEFVNGNSAARRIYTMFDNPKKIKYLMGKGYLKSFSQVNQNDERGNQNDEGVNHFDYPHNRGEVNHFDEHRIIKDNKNIETSALAMEKPSRVSNKNRTLTRAEINRLEYAL